MRAQNFALFRDEVAGLRLHPVGDELPVVVGGDEAYLLAVRLVGYGQTSLGRDRAYLVLCVLANRQKQTRELRLAQRKQDV